MDTVQKYGLKKSHAVAIVIIMILMAAVFVIDIFELFKPDIFLGPGSKTSTAFSLIGSLLTIIYGLFAYKKPHGNMLRYLFLVLGLLLGFYGIYRSDIYLPMTYCYFVAGSISVYISGRLNKIRKNRWLIVLAGLLIFAGLIMKMVIRQTPFLVALRLADELYIFIALASFYFARYEYHKTRGLEEDLKNLGQWDVK